MAEYIEIEKHERWFFPLKSAKYCFSQCYSNISVIEVFDDEVIQMNKNTK